MPEANSRRRLTQTEAAFLYAETPQTPMHVGGCGLYAGNLSTTTLCDLIASRLDRLPQYRRKAVFAPLNLAHPTWEDDPDFDLSHHIDEVELPAPADDRVISQVCGHLFSTPLDRDRPLWKLTLIHGRPDGDSMVLARVHQAMLEGVSGIDLMLTLHDFTSRPTPGAPGADAWQPEATPDALSLLQEAVQDRIAGLESGADDYLTKPFEPRELLLRIATILRRARPPLPDHVRFGEVRYHPAQDELRRGGVAVRLTTGEAALLRVLAANPGVTLSRDALCAKIGAGVSPRAIDVQVARLRRKIESDPRAPRYLRTVWGRGYVLRTE